MNAEHKVAAEIVAEGRVQGVGYRDFCVTCAGRLGVVGYAMNLADGRVRVVAEGRRDAIEAMVREMERGPRMARVERVTVTWRAARGEFAGFGVRDAGRDA